MDKMHQIIQDLNWRYAVKKYDPTKNITQKDLQVLKESVRLSPSSVGLQAYQILDVVDVKIREKLKEVSFDQSQITDASHLFVFCNMIDIPVAYVQKLVDTMAQVRNVPIDSLSGYKSFLLQNSQNPDTEKRNLWTSKQTYIALGHLLQTAAQLRIDATPMEGFENEAYNEILGLNELGLNASVACALGFRSEEDSYQHKNKVRKPIEDLFIMV